MAALSAKYDGYVPFKLSCRPFCGVETNFIPVDIYGHEVTNIFLGTPKKASNFSENGVIH